MRSMCKEEAMKIHVVFWSGTGNTEAMARAVAEGAKREGAEVRLIPVSEATASDVESADAVALGCPSMGAEALEESEMEPFVASIEASVIKDKVLGLFGAYDWGDGQWMRDWTERMTQAGAKLAAEGFAVRNTPDEAGLAACRVLGIALVQTNR